MTTFFTADTHFLDHRVDHYTQRLFVRPEHSLHDDWLRSIWNSQVQPGDTVYVLGDFVCATSIPEFRSVMETLNGSVFLLKGISDHSSTLQHERLLKWTYRQSVQICGRHSVLSHEPKIVWAGQHLGAYHLHGHTHGLLSLPGRALDVGIDSAAKILGTHRLFTEAEVHEILSARSPVAYDGRKVHDVQQPT